MASGDSTGPGKALGMSQASRLPFPFLLLCVSAAIIDPHAICLGAGDRPTFCQRRGECQPSLEDRSAILSTVFKHVPRDTTWQAREALAGPRRARLKVTELKVRDIATHAQPELNSTLMYLSAGAVNTSDENLVVARVLVVFGCRHVSSGFSTVLAGPREISALGRSVRPIDMPGAALTLPGDYVVFVSIVEWPEGAAPIVLYEHSEALSIAPMLDEAAFRRILAEGKPLGREDAENSLVDRCLEHLDLSPATIDILSEVKDLHSMRLHDRLVRQQDFEQLARLPHLQSLSLVNCVIEDSELAAVGRLPSLVALRLSRCNLRPGTLARSGALGRLKHLQFTNGSLSEADVTAIRLLAGLETLDLSHTDLSDDDCKVLVAATNLLELNLAGNHISSAAIQRLGRLSSLEALNLSQTNFADADLVVLPDFRRLRRLGIAGTRVSPEALKTALERRVLDELTVDASQLQRCQLLFPEARIVRRD